LKDTGQPQGLELSFKMSSTGNFCKAEGVPNFVLIEVIPGLGPVNYFIRGTFLGEVGSREKIKTY